MFVEKIREKGTHNQGTVVVMDEFDDMGAGDFKWNGWADQVIKGFMVPISLRMDGLAAIAPLGYSKTCLEVSV